VAEVVLFHYQSKPGLLHRYDPRHKLPLFVLLAAALFHAGPLGMALLTLVAGVGIAAARLPVKRVGRELLPFTVLLAVSFAALSLTTPGRPVAGLPAFTVEGARAGGFLVWRLFVVFLFGALFAATTSFGSLRSAVVWYLKPFPILPAGRIATMLGLTLSLVPLLFDTYRGIAEAQASRCVANSRRPLRRLAGAASSLLVRAAGRADALVLAMEARCYVDDRTVRRLRSRLADWLVTAVLLALSVCCLLLRR